jgi:UDP-2,4-diacetamido-2,4,6-trideoxy-beta-L-altropyranose hydrolase
MLKVLFRVDDGLNIGAGHLMRCLALAEAVHDEGGTVHLSTVRASRLHAKWEGVDASVRVEPRGIGSETDLETTLAAMTAIGADWLVIDGYSFDTAWIDRAALGRHTLLLDDLGQRDAKVSLVLNQNPGAEMRYAAAYQHCGRPLLGLHWLLLRREWRMREYKAEARRLLITLGGEDQDYRTLSIMQALLADGRDFVADVVSAASEAGWGHEQALADLHPNRFILHRGPVSLPPLMCRSTVVVSGGGLTALEAVTMGAVAVVLVLAENQRPGIENLAEVGLVKIGGAQMAEVAHQALDLLWNEAARMAMSRQKKHKIDWQGPARIAAVLKGIKGDDEKAMAQIFGTTTNSRR